MDDERFGGVAHTRTLHLRVEHDVERAAQVGRRVHVHVTVTVPVDDDRNGGVLTDAGEQLRSASGDQTVDVVVELHQLDRGVV